MFWYDYVKPKHEGKVMLQKLSYKNFDRLIVYIKTEDIAKDVEAMFDTLNYK